MYQKHEIGRIGEEAATNYLKKLGYNVIERNFLCKRGEIDIICLDKKELVFVEVKTRTSAEFGNPADAVNNIKQKHIYKAAEYYIYKRHLENEFIRIDVIEVYIKKTKIYINHLKQVM